MKTFHSPKKTIDQEVQWEMMTHEQFYSLCPKTVPNPASSPNINYNININTGGSYTQFKEVKKTVTIKRRRNNRNKIDTTEAIVSQRKVSKDDKVPVKEIDSPLKEISVSDSSFELSSSEYENTIQEQRRKLFL